MFRTASAVHQVLGLHGGLSVQLLALVSVPGLVPDDDVVDGVLHLDDGGVLLALGGASDDGDVSSWAGLQDHGSSGVVLCWVSRRCGSMRVLVSSWVPVRIFWTLVRVRWERRISSRACSRSRRVSRMVVMMSVVRQVSAVVVMARLAQATHPRFIGC